MDAAEYWDNCADDATILAALTDDPDEEALWQAQAAHCRRRAARFRQELMTDVHAIWAASEVTP